MQYIATKDLIPHPRNNELFDDIMGDKWEDFKKSIIRRGVVEGVVITQDLVIVSGHQRVRACKELDISEVPCRVTHYPDFDKQTGTPKEDMILEDLISTNIMQRGIGNVNPMKMARCIVELERIYGIRQGSSNEKGINQYTSCDQNNFGDKTQKELSSQLNMSDEQLRNYKKLNNLIPEFQELVEEGKLKATTAYKIWAKLPQDEQERFFEEIGEEKISKMSQKKTEEYINIEQEVKEVIVEKEVIIDNTDYDKISKLNQVLEHKENRLRELESEKNKLENYVKLSEDDKNKYIKLEKEFSNNKKQIEQLNNALQYATQEKNKIESKLNEINSSENEERRKIEELKLQEEKLKHQAHISIFDLQTKIHNFIIDASPSVFLQGAVASSSYKLKDDLLDSVIALEEFTRSLREILDSNIEQEQNNIIDAVLD